MSGRRKKAYSVEFKLSVVSKTETSSIRAEQGKREWMRNGFVNGKDKKWSWKK